MLLERCWPFSNVPLQGYCSCKSSCYFCWLCLAGSAFWAWTSYVYADLLAFWLKRKAGLEHVVSPQALWVPDRKKWAETLKQQQSSSELAAISSNEQTVTVKVLAHMKKREQLTDRSAHSLILLWECFFLNFLMWEFKGLLLHLNVT